jgi:GntR family transcriptional regulator
MQKRNEVLSARPLVVDENNRAPLYHQIFMILRSKIIDGEYSEKSLLPSENEIARLFSVSRITAIRALNELAAQGLVSRARGKGTIVRLVETGMIVRGPAERIQTKAKQAFPGQDAATIEVVSFGLVTPPLEVAKILNILDDSMVRRIVRIGRFEGKPFRFVTSYLPAAIGKGWKRSDLERSPIAYLIERSGIKMGRIDERVTATLGDTQTSEHLEVAVGSPLIRIVRTVFDTTGKVIEHVYGYYPPERYEYSVSVTRQGRLLSPARALDS